VLEQHGSSIAEPRVLRAHAFTSGAGFPDGRSANVTATICETGTFIDSRMGEPGMQSRRRARDRAHDGDIARGAANRSVAAPQFPEPRRTAPSAAEPRFTK